jgi:2-phosphosulfolactate phosphatase
VITTTTNGTVALRACAAAHKVWVGALLNLGALAEEIRRNPPPNLLLVCAGTFETLALEDVWAAGRLLFEFTEGALGVSPAGWTDAAQVALATARAFPDPLAALSASRNGRALIAKGRAEEVAWCAQLSSLSAVGEMRGGVIRAVSGR